MDNSQNLSAKEPKGLTFDMLFGDDVIPEVDAAIKKASDDARQYQINVVKKHEADSHSHEKVTIREHGGYQARLLHGLRYARFSTLASSQAKVLGADESYCRYVFFNQTLPQMLVHNTIHHIGWTNVTNNCEFHVAHQVHSLSDYVLSIAPLSGSFEGITGPVFISFAAGNALEKNSDDGITELNNDAKESLHKMFMMKG